jgi:AcrR family transcriptional regulator
MVTRARKKPKDQYHHGDLRRALVDAARIELKQVGWRELSLRNVAKRVGVTHTAAYHHFKDKEDLLAQIAADGIVKLHDMIEEEMSKVGPDPIDRMVAASIGYVRMAFADPEAYELMFVVNREHKGEYVTEHMKGRPSAFDQLIRTVTAAREAAGFGKEELMPHVLMHWEIIHGLAMLALAGQHSRLGVDTMEHTVWVANRLRALYPRSKT